MPAHILPRYFKGRVERWMERKIDQIFFMLDILQKKIYIISKNLIFVTTSKSPQHL